MHIIIVGCGKVGATIAKNLSCERDVNITIIDNDQDAFDKAADTIDAMFIKGNGLAAGTLIEAGANDADLVISTTNADEVNILCCVLAKHLGVKHSAARVRNPEYALGQERFWKDLGLDIIINPEYETAREISRLLRFPTADNIDTFVGGRVELVSYKVSGAEDFFVGKTVSQVFKPQKMNVMLAMVYRGQTALIPNGDLVFEKDDIVRILGRPSHIMDFFANFGKNSNKIKDLVVIGGSRITYYLAELLHRHSSDTKIKVIEIDREKCEAMSERFPRCLIINGDGTDEDIVATEIRGHTEAVVCLTDRDEENTVMAMYSQQSGVKKVIFKINYINKNMVNCLGLGSIVSPQHITSDRMIRYVRGLSNISGGSIKTVYNLTDSEHDRVEATEFHINHQARCIDTPLKELKIRKGVLVGCIIRNSNIIIPSGDTEIHKGDSIIIIAKNEQILEPDDILSNN